MENKKATTTKAKPIATMRMKGDMEFTHHLFKLEAADMLHNKGFAKFQPDVVRQTHGHIYHSVDGRTGVAQKLSAPMGGHFHEVITEWETDSNGEQVLVRAECGPALEKKRFKNRIGVSASKNVPRQFETEDKEAPIVDNHTHPVTYLNTQIINPSLQKQLQEQDRAKISHMTRGAVPQVRSIAPTTDIVEVQS